MHLSFVIFIVFLHSIETKFSITNKEALKWLNIPPRWREQHSSNEITHSLKQLEHLNENGILQYDIHLFESVSMEVFFEVSKLSQRIK
jgi:hypothetical protein